MLLTSACLLPLLGSVVYALSCDTIRQTEGSLSWKESPIATVDEDWFQGIKKLPIGNVCGAEYLRLKMGTKGAKFPIWASNDVDDAEVKRVVFAFPGRLRDSWNYFGLARNARNKAAAKWNHMKRSEIAIVTPIFQNKYDRNAGSTQPTDYVWGGNSWSAGGVAKWPTDADPGSMSSFEVVDSIIEYIHKRWKKAEVIVITGHSAGAQAVNRYSTMTHKEDPSVSYCIQNPGSWLWMNPTRPLLNMFPCFGFDDYKYGLSGRSNKYISSQNATLGRKGLTKRLIRRPVHILIGANDEGLGDKSCKALLQGRNHKERAQEYRADIISNSPKFEFPKAWTWDYAKGCTHNATCMFGSAPGLKYLFYQGFPGATLAGQGKGKRGDADQDETF